MIENKRIAHYKLVRKLGQGAAGVVYEGFDEKLRMKVAIKVLAPHMMKEPDMVKRFEREARAAANLHHPNIAHVFFVDRTSTDLLFYAMEYLEGPSLADVIHKRMVVSGRQMLNIMIHIGRALKHATEKDIIHRDVKPANILVTPEQGAKLLDFGLAKQGASDAGLTKTGIALGTPYYISPEQAQGKEVDFHSDMYSFGATCFELLTGWPPYRASDIHGILLKHIQAPVPNLKTINDAYPKKLRVAIETMMAKDPAQRYATYDALLEALEDVLHTETDFLRARWTFCQTCDCATTMNPGGLCLREHIIEPPPEEHHYYEVLLNGFRKPGARLRLREYMVLSTGRPPVHVDHMLDRLPVTLTPRLEDEAAHALKEKLVKLGGDIVLRKVDTEYIPSAHNRRSLMFDTGPLPIIPEALRPRKASQHADAPPPPPEKNTRKVPVKIIGIAIGVVALIVAATVMIFSANPNPNTAESVARNINISNSGAAPKKVSVQNAAPQAETAPQIPEDTPESEDSFVSVSATNPDKNCNITLIGNDDQGFADSLALLCGQDLSRSMVLLSTTDLPRIDLTVDMRLTPVRTFVSLPPLTGEPWDPTVISGKGLNVEGLRPYIIARIGNAAIRHVNPATPLWLQTGYALALVHRILPRTYDPTPRLRTMRKVLSTHLINKGLLEHSSGAIDQVAGFCSFLAREYHFSSLATLAKHHGNNGDSIRAFQNTYSIPAPLLRGRWFSSLRQQQ